MSGLLGELKEIGDAAPPPFKRERPTVEDRLIEIASKVSPDAVGRTITHIEYGETWVNINLDNGKVFRVDTCECCGLGYSLKGKS